MNVVSVDWRYLSSVVDYFAAAEHTVSAGRRAGQILVDLLINQLGQQPQRIHAIGHRYFLRSEFPKKLNIRQLFGKLEIAVLPVMAFMARFRQRRYCTCDPFD